MLTIGDPRAGVKFEGMDACIAMGAVWSPREFAANAMQTKQRPLFDAWALWAQLPDAVVRVLESRLLPRAASHGLVRSDGGVVYPVLTLQSAGLQVRYVLSLADPSTRQWFSAVAAEGTVTFAVDIAETQQLAVMSMPCERRSAQQVEDLVGQCASLSPAEAVVDAGRVVRSLAQCSALPSCVEGVSVHELRLVCALGFGEGSAQAFKKSEARVLN